MKKQTAIFVGAGASKAFGLPLTKEIFPLILKKSKNQELFDNDVEERVELINFLNQLYPGLSIIKESALPQITDVLSLLDHLIINFQTPLIANKNLTYYRDLLERAIIEVLDIDFLKNSPFHDADVPLVLRKFVKLIYSNHIQNYQTIISTNYDLSIETVLFNLINDPNAIKNDIDFGLSWRDPAQELKFQPSNPTLSIYKLHGSLNWLKCDLCDHIYINTLGSVTHQAYRKVIDNENTCDCGNAPLKPLIIAPSLERTKIDTNLLNIWKSSLEKLRIADEWIIIGYSLPAEDLNIKSILIRAMNGRENKPKITVVQRGMEAKPRYDAMFKSYKYISGGLEVYLEKEMKNYYKKFGK